MKGEGLEGGWSRVGGKVELLRGSELDKLPHVL